MRRREFDKRLDQAIKRAYERIESETDKSSLYSRGLSMEGWMGGYIAALQDVSLILRDIEPRDEREIWKASK